MITPSFALTATERVLPRMALDFTTASLDSRVTFTRSGNTATVVNSSGFIAPINANLPRFDYDPTTLVCKGLLIEEARTNLLLYSNDFTQASWTKVDASISTPVGLSPDGTQNINRITFTGAGGNQRVVQTATTVIGQVYTSSVYLKGTVGETVTLEFDTDVLTVTLTSSFVRYSKSGTANTIAAVTRIISRAGNTATVVDCYGVQTELGAFPTSYIPTTTTAVTRNADVATMTGTNFSDWFNASEGAIYSQFTPAFPSTLATGVFSPLQIDAGSTVNRIQIRISDAVGIRGLFQVAGAPTFLGGSAFAANSTNNAGLAFKNASNIMYVNTNGNGTSANNVPAGLNTLRIGSEGTTATTFTGIIKKISFYPQRLINNEVQAFSK